MGAFNKVSGNKITENKVRRKIYPKKKNLRKSPKSCESEVKSTTFSCFHKKYLFTHLYFGYSHPGVFNIYCPFLHGLNTICSHAFSNILGLFSRDVFV